MTKLSKCDLYQLLKTDFEREMNLTELSPKLAIALCKYRTSNHKLEVETGRHARPLIPRKDIKCNKCNLNENGNKIHHFNSLPKIL